eukprot:2837249-Rhodomonas_salina.1
MTRIMAVPRHTLSVAATQSCDSPQKVDSEPECIRQGCPETPRKTAQTDCCQFTGQFTHSMTPPPSSSSGSHLCVTAHIYPRWRGGERARSLGQAAGSEHGHRRLPAQQSTNTA